MSSKQAARPEWLRVRFPTGGKYQELLTLMRDSDLNTVCEEAGCPNIGECWGRGTATFMILGDTCTRSCGFCAVKTGRPGTVDFGEPARVAVAAKRMSLRHVVITSVDRDDLPDGGAGIFADTIRSVRGASPGITLEVLTPDFLGDWGALATVLQAGPEVFAHNVETVPRLHRRVRPKAKYQRSLELLRRAKQLSPNSKTKSGLMVGLGENRDELIAVFRDLREHDVELLTVGQYLRPTAKHLPIERYYHPDEFAALKAEASRMGFARVESGPLVRSSYHAEDALS